MFALGEDLAGEGGGAATTAGIEAHLATSGAEGIFANVDGAERPTPTATQAFTSVSLRSVPKSVPKPVSGPEPVFTLSVGGSLESSAQFRVSTHGAHHDHRRIEGQG